MKKWSKKDIRNFTILENGKKLCILVKKQTNKQQTKKQKQQQNNNKQQTKTKQNICNYTFKKVRVLKSSTSAIA